MAGFDHGPNMADPNERPEIVSRNTRIGLVLFAIYLVLYCGFVLVNAFAPELMEQSAGGANFAIWSGFGLILAAFLLALIYGWLCRADSPLSNALDARDAQDAGHRTRGDDQ